MMDYLLEKRILICDWDGTLFDSMAAKTRSFGKVLSSNIPALSVERAEADYRRLSGIPRRDIFIQLLNENHVPYTESLIEKMSLQLTAHNKESLSHASLYADTLLFLEEVLRQNKMLYLSSSVPCEELLYFTQRNIPDNIYRQIRGVLGSQIGLSKGPEHVSHILQGTSSSKSECIMIGDDLADIALANESGIDSILIDRHSRHFDVTPRVVSLKELIW